ncbi:HD-GYP domain-containing protein [Vibrio cyclitrophicus]|uniref:HD-GYP domain-containing protein n=1 Tax=Vibrio cyclitrophicus TaxID=47951 RepID=UPI0002D6CD52|nr:HD-GYP domain-containing protein [Vibrio cyclitrophicus]OED88250.1 phosphohydrolase [Vibrio cyclitrophicus ZF30]PMJ33540.1 phosphohydrolase [Vibrio cyclitrophicus]PMP55936.1 phosphohydrolase [Vibrio cyclitrophicus]
MSIDFLTRKKYLTSHDFYRDLIDFFVQEAKSDIGYFHFYSHTNEEIVLNVWSTSVLEHCHCSYETHYPLSSAGIWADSIRMKKPVIQNNDVVAVIGISNNNEPYTHDFVSYFYSMINDIWPQVQTKVSKIESGLAKNKLEFDSSTPIAIMTNMLGAISRALEIRDEYTSSHQRNVAHICNLIADKLSLEDSVKEGLVIGALVHDIGKITIPSQILNKPGKLMPAEYKLLQSHSEVGAKIFHEVIFPWPIVEMIEQHHERLDGSGYPNGFKGNEILLEARIIAVADTFDAMASDRPYRKAVGAEKAINTLERGRNKLYDPCVVDAFLTCYKEDETLGGLYTPVNLQ